MERFLKIKNIRIKLCYWNRRSRYRNDRNRFIRHQNSLQCEQRPWSAHNSTQRAVKMRVEFVVVSAEHRHVWLFSSKFSSPSLELSFREITEIPALVFASGQEAGSLTFLVPSLGDVCDLTLLSAPGPSVFHCRSGWEPSSSVPPLVWNSPWMRFQPNREWRQKSRGWFSSKYNQILLQL